MPYIYDWDAIWPKVEECLDQGITRPAEIAKRVGVPYQALMPQIYSMNMSHLFEIKHVKHRKGTEVLRSLREGVRT